jgi:hypothetical protein
MGRWGAIFVVVWASVGRVGRMWGELRRIGAAQRTQYVVPTQARTASAAPSSARSRSAGVSSGSVMRLARRPSRDRAAAGLLRSW